jgi:hypothetical protein
MSKPMPLSDFRAVRIVLDPGDFALGSDDPDPPPSDLVSREAWVGYTGLPDDVAVRTSNHHGTALQEVSMLHFRWVMVTGESGEPLFDPMLDAGDASRIQPSMRCTDITAPASRHCGAWSK